MKRSNPLTTILVLIAMVMTLPQLALGEGKRQIKAPGAEYRVVINHEEQYSIWRLDREIPKGWKGTGFVGSKDGALNHIEEVWTDMRPLSDRRKKALEIYQKQRPGE